MIPSSSSWPNKPTRWIEDSTLYVSIPFTWNLPLVHADLRQVEIFWTSAVVGGPAVELMPGFFADLPWVTEGHSLPGVLQRVNSLATRTTRGCINRCKFCGIGSGLIEPGPFQELESWPDLPIICDNNLLAASPSHFEKVIDRLSKFGWADFSQGLDIRLLTPDHAKLLATIKRPMIRLALDSQALEPTWLYAYEALREAGIWKKHIRSYALIAYDSSPEEAWNRCSWIEAFGIKALPMWYHPLDALSLNAISPSQISLGWNDFERRRIMKWFYKHQDIKK